MEVDAVEVDAVEVDAVEVDAVEIDAVEVDAVEVDAVEVQQLMCLVRAVCHWHSQCLEIIVVVRQIHKLTHTLLRFTQTSLNEMRM